MDPRASMGAAQHRARARIPQRAVTGGPHVFPQPPPQRPTLPPKLTSVRSTSQPVALMDRSQVGTGEDKSNAQPLLYNGELVASPDAVNVADDDDDDLEPPAKRVKTAGDAFQSVERDVDNQEVDVIVQDEVHRIHPGSPLPAPPPFSSVTARLAPHRHQRLGIDSSARKAHNLEPPAAAVRLLSPKKAADFSPWTNEHPEDILNENVIKTGYFDKNQGPNQAECNSAKATISASLHQKNNHGLSLLGYLVTTVLERRLANGKCTAPSTFKPPPRVTVIDSKREAWLRDLANPEVPLRKQSRTIPHGIRGKLLMEQCMAKSVPLQRAVWLAKCVGANELRAFRRKGVTGSVATSGEAKWVREWTIHVQQFLEDVIAACGQDGWQQKMNYAVKLAYAFYSEKLLDKDHYLDWIVSSLTHATRACLPIWSVLAPLYWEDLTRYVRRGRRLAEGILHHLDSITQAGQGTEMPLKLRLQQLLVRMATTSRACLIIPRRWEEYKHLFISDQVGTASNTVFTRIVRRNESLSQPLASAKDKCSPRLRLCSELDSASLDIDVGKLANDCILLVPGASRLIRALFDWASSPYRAGISRAYLAAHIVAHLHASGIDTDSVILDYLQTAGDLPLPSVNLVHRVIIELVHLSAFSVGRYMRWLITSGMIGSAMKATCATGLMAALPSTDLPLHVLNTRKSLLKRVGLASDETLAVQEVLQQCNLACSVDTAQQKVTVEIPPSLSTSAQFDTCRQICDWVAARTKEDDITLDVFCVARNAIEAVGDMRSLATFMQITMAVDDCSILATLCDSINLHADAFAAMGELKALVDGVRNRYMSLRSTQPLERVFILALQNVAERLPEESSLVKLLKDDLTICEQQNSLAVCSPASDSLIGMQASTLDSDQDLDAVFASGNTMDEQLMQRVFTRVLQREAKSSAHYGGVTSRVCGWLNQLRSVDGAGMFENLLQTHISSVVFHSDFDYGFWANGIVYLVASGCSSLSEVARTVAGEVKSPETAVRLLPLFLSAQVAEVGLQDAEKYRFCLQQDRCQDIELEHILKLVHLACESLTYPADDSNIRTFVVRAMSRHSPAVADWNPSETSRASFQRLLDGILAGVSTEPLQAEHANTSNIVSQASPLSLPYCLASLRCRNNILAEGGDDSFGNALLDAFRAHSDVWPQLLESAGGKVNAQVRDWAQGQLLLMASGDTVDTAIPATEQAPRLLDLLTVSSSFAPEEDDTATVLTITERLKDLEVKLAELNGFEIEPSNQACDVLFHLHILLPLVSLSIRVPPKDLPAPQEARISLLTTLCSLICVPRLRMSEETQEQLCDLASTLADLLPDTALTTTKQQSPNNVLADRRVQSILGTISDESDTWLALASHVQPVGSQQQRLLNRNVSQHSPQSSSRTPMQGPAQHQRGLSHGSPSVFRQDNKTTGEIKVTPFAVRQWEMIPDAAPIMGDNDASLSLRLFGGRKV